MKLRETSATESSEQWAEQFEKIMQVEKKKNRRVRRGIEDRKQQEVKVEERSAERAEEESV